MSILVTLNDIYRAYKHTSSITSLKGYKDKLKFTRDGFMFNTMQPYTYLTSYPKPHKVGEWRFSTWSKAKITYTHEPEIKKLLKIFGLRAIWLHNEYGWADLKIIGYIHQVRAFCMLLDFMIRFRLMDRRYKSEAYNKRLMKYRKIQRKWPGKLTKPPSFIASYSKRKLQILEIGDDFLNNLLDEMRRNKGLPHYDDIDDYIEAMNLKRPRTTKQLKHNREIW